MFIQVSKHCRTCETSTESTNKDKRGTKKELRCSPEMTEVFLYL